jgi:hypothetical protein
MAHCSLAKPILRSARGIKGGRKPVENNMCLTETQAEYPRFLYEDRKHPLYCSLLDLFEAWGKNAEKIPSATFLSQERLLP